MCASNMFCLASPWVILLRAFITREDLEITDSSLGNDREMAFSCEQPIKYCSAETCYWMQVLKSRLGICSNRETTQDFPFLWLHLFCVVSSPFRGQNWQRCGINLIFLHRLWKEPNELAGWCLDGPHGVWCPQHREASSRVSQEKSIVLWSL